jgi:hypothetical protein
MKDLQLSEHYFNSRRRADDDITESAQDFEDDVDETAKKQGMQVIGSFG